MVFQTMYLSHMTVAENMAFSLRLAGVSKAKRYERAKEVGRVLQLEPLLNRKPGSLVRWTTTTSCNWAGANTQS